MVFIQDPPSSFLHYNIPVVLNDQLSPSIAETLLGWHPASKLPAALTIFPQEGVVHFWSYGLKVKQDKQYCGCSTRPDKMVSPIA